MFYGIVAPWRGLAVTYQTRREEAGMSRAKVSFVGPLKLSEAQEPLCPFVVGGVVGTIWINVSLPNAEEDCPGIGPRPEEPPPDAYGESREEYVRATDDYDRAARAHPNHEQAVSRFLELQDHEPQPGPPGWWIYRNKVWSVEGEPRDTTTDSLLVKHHVLKQGRYYEKVRREVEALENSSRASRESRFLNP